MGVSYNVSGRNLCELGWLEENPHIYLKVKFNLYKARYILAPATF